MMQIDSSSGLGPKDGVVRPDSGNSRWVGESRLGGRLLAVGLAVCLLASPSVVLAGDHTKEVSKESGMGAAAALSSLVYSPVKLVYAVGGLVIGSLAWVFTAGDTDVADKVYVRSLRGTYVITPEILRGEEPLVFIGRDPSVMPVGQPKAVAAGPVAGAYSDDVSDVSDVSGNAVDDSGW